MFVLFLVSVLHAALVGGSAPALDLDQERGTVVGLVIDAETHDPLPGASVRLRELGRAQVTDSRGRFRFEDVPIRRLTIAVQFLGFAPTERQVVSRADEVTDVTIALEPSVLEMPDIVVTGTGRERGAADTYQPTAVLSGSELQRQLETSIAASIAHLPGLSQQYNGPVATQPVIRGLSGDRVLVLEDGQRTGDLSTTAADHAVAIDPQSAERIEVVRGPAGLLYGPNALGGVVNVIRDDIPPNRPPRLTGTLSSSLESVNGGLAGALELQAPAGSFAVRAELSGRTAGDSRTPLGTLESTDVDAFATGGAVSLIRPWGFVGVSGRYANLRYGIPGEFNGELIPGAHEGGVDADARRTTIRFRAIHLDLPGFFSTGEVDASFNHYIHDEIEGYTDEGRPIIGAHFDQIAGGGSVSLRHEHYLHDHPEHDIRFEGAMGLWGYGRDLATRGLYVGTRPASEVALAGFMFEEFGYNGLRFQLGARFEWRSIAPRNEAPISVGSRTIPVRSRSFGNVSGSAALLYDFTPAVTAGLNLARAFRTPAIEELYSGGPHLADFSFNIGNPDLPSEVGHGADLFVRTSHRRLQLEAGAFVNRISNFIYYRPTGELDPRHRRYPVYQASTDNAVFVGADGRVQWQFAPNLVLDATANFVRGTRLKDDDPLPAIPPLNGHLTMRYETREFFATAGVSAAASQNRVPRPQNSGGGEVVRPERPTDGHGMLHAAVGYRFDHGGTYHSVSLRADNLTDTVWHDHLSRIKDVAPQPGRNIQLTYRVHF
ncbi:MAG: TonB-dependent receptor [Bacteroidota bacterium]